MWNDNLWRVVANASLSETWEKAWQVPTFYVQASSEDEAYAIAARIIDPHKRYEIHLTTMEVSDVA